MKRLFSFLVALLAAFTVSAQQGSITSMTSKGPLVLTTFDYTAGAFCSVKWNGLEFIDANDHGRCLQSAMSVDWLGEGYNPTEAGSSPDGNLPRASSSKVLNYVVGPSTLATEVRMAYYRDVKGEKVSNFIHRKWVQAGVPGRPNIVRYEVAFEFPAAARHFIAQLELLTGYHTPTLDRYYKMNPLNGALSELSDGPGEQEWPVIFANAAGTHAVGVVSRTPLVRGGYGRWRPEAMRCAQRCTKWNVVSRYEFPSGTYRWEGSLSFNDLSGVVQDLMAEGAK